MTTFPTSGILAPDERITIECPECGKILFEGTQQQARRLIIYCVDCAKQGGRTREKNNGGVSDG
jgi:hypothetical protein